MCLNKSLSLFLTYVKGKIYFTPERKNLHFLLNSLVNQEEPETSAWQPLTLILFAKMKGCLSFGGLVLVQSSKASAECGPDNAKALQGGRLALSEVLKRWHVQDRDTLRPWHGAGRG